MGNENNIQCSLWRWWRICRELRRRGQGVRESGAFLLGRNVAGKAHITSAIYYDDIDRNALSTGIIRLKGSTLGKVWQICRDTGLEVIADVHTHPDGAGQSQSDQQHPMISKAGHVALILPQFARHPFLLSKIGVYRYSGSRQWSVCPPPQLRWLQLAFEVSS